MKRNSTAVRFICYVPFSPISNCIVFLFCTCVKICIILNLIVFRFISSYPCPVCRFLFPLGRGYRGYSLPSCFQGPARGFPYVEINQWRATIGCFRASLHSLRPLGKPINPFSILFQVFKLHCFCCCFIVTSLFVLPLTLITQFLIVHSLITQLCFLPLFARMYYLARTVIYVTFELVKRVPPGITSFVRYKCLTVMHCIFWYAYFYTGSITVYTLHTQ